MTNKEKLFEAIYKECDDLQDCYNTLKEAGMKEDYCKGVTYEHIHLQHLLRTADYKMKPLSINNSGDILEWNVDSCTGDIGWHPSGIVLDLSIPLSDQSEDTLIQLAKVIL